MILLIDNYDSFVFNLERYFKRLGCATKVVRNDAVDLEALAAARPQGIVFSPGPCTPDDAGKALEIARRCGSRTPMLGICLGHQILAQALGTRIARAPEPRHGRTSAIEHDGRGLFAGVPSPLTVCRYHSLAVVESSLPNSLRVTARAADDGVVMALAHTHLPIYGLQFHPESILTEHGYRLLANFLRRAGHVPADALPEEAHSPAASPAPAEPRRAGTPLSF